MRSIPLYCFLSGLHFALLQFGYIYLLQIHVTATWLTFALVTLTWMVGALSGLWLKKGDAHTGLGMGLLGYLIVHLLTRLFPFSLAILPAAAVCILAGGFWAGRFFPFMTRRLPRTDLIFFHENNGFILGILLCFAGLTLLGRVSLLWMPLLTGGGLALFGPQPFTTDTAPERETSTEKPA